MRSALDLEADARGLDALHPAQSASGSGARWRARLTSAPAPWGSAVKKKIDARQNTLMARKTGRKSTGARLAVAWLGLTMASSVAAMVTPVLRVSCWAALERLVARLMRAGGTS